MHELGHNLSLWHSNRLECRDAAGARVTLSTTCDHIEYGDDYDAMGSSSNLGHFNAGQKAAFKWLDGRSQTVTADAALTLTPYESGSGLKAAVIPGASGDYWLEFRRPQGLDSFLSSYPGVTNGVLLHRKQNLDGTNLLDARPGGTGHFRDAALPTGASWATPGAPSDLPQRPRLDECARTGDPARGPSDGVMHARRGAGVEKYRYRDSNPGYRRERAAS